MKLISLITAVFVLNMPAAFAQEKLWTTQTKVSEAVRFEQEIDSNAVFLSQNVTLSKDYYPLLDKHPVQNPVIVSRKPVGYLPVYAEYYFTASDSVLRVVTYDWEKDAYGNFFDKQKIWKEESDKLETYNSEYERIRNMIITQLGKPGSTDKKPKAMGEGYDRYFKRVSVWDNNDMHAELTMLFAANTYRIRLNLYWKK